MNKKLLLVKRGNIENVDVEYYKKETGRDLSVKELRLLPYIQHVFLNNEYIRKGIHINDEEFLILESLSNANLIKFGRAKGQVGYYQVTINNLFRKVITKTLFDSYAAKSSTENSYEGASYKEITGRNISDNELKAMKIVLRGSMDGGYINESDISKSIISILEKLEKDDLIYFKKRQNDEERFNIGVTKIYWDLIINALYKDVEEKVCEE